MDLISVLNEKWEEQITIFQLLDEYKSIDYLKLLVRLSRKIIEKSLHLTNNPSYLEGFYVNIKEDYDQELLASEIVYFLGSILLMPMSYEHVQRLMSNFIVISDKEMVIACIRYITTRSMEELAKNAYLGAYLVPLNIPSEFQSLSQIQPFKTQLASKRDEFIQVHKNVSIYESEINASKELEAMALKKEQEQRIVQKQVKSLESKMKKSELNEQWMSICKVYYQEQCILNESKMKVMELNRQINDFDDQQDQLMNQKSQLEQKLNGNAEDIIVKLNEDLKKSNFIQQTQKEDLEIQTKLLKVLQQSFSKSITRVDVLAIEDKISKLNGELNFATHNLISKEQQQDTPLVEQQLNALLNKKMFLQEKLATLNANQPQLQVPNHLKSTRSEYIYKKKELNDLVASKNTLITQLQDINEQLKIKDDQIRKLEIKAGIEGFTKMRAELIKLSNKKSKLDATKMETLEDLSALVVEINKIAIEKKALINPKSSQLKKLRLKNGKQEEIINENQFAYDAKIVHIKREVQELADTVTLLASTSTTMEGRKDELDDLLEVVKHHSTLLKDEKRKNLSKSEESLDTIKEKLKRKLFEMEVKLKSSLEIERNIKDVIEPTKRSIESYTVLTELLGLLIKDNEVQLNGVHDLQGTENRLLI